MEACGDAGRRRAGAQGRVGAEQAGAQARGALRHGQGPGHDTARGSAMTQPNPPMTRPHARGHARPRRACVRKLGELAGPAGCALGALSLFLT